MILETERLLLRELEQADFSDLAELLQDPEVVYAYEHCFTREDVQEWLDRQQARYRNDGIGLWAVLLKDTGRMIGQAGLTKQPFEGEKVLEAGYLLKKEFWHQGYAAEAAEACKNYAFRELKAEKVCSIIKKDNLPSIKVAERIGMIREAEFTARYYNGDMRHYLYSISRSNP